MTWHTLGHVQRMTGCIIVACSIYPSLEVTLGGVTTEVDDIAYHWACAKNDGMYYSRERFELSTLACGIYPSIVVVTTEVDDIATPGHVPRMTDCGVEESFSHC
jgi:hypothetical protein